MPTTGVSVAVPEPWGTQLQDYRIGVGDAAALHIPTHITLLPPHEVAEQEMPLVVAHLEQVADATDPFRVHLRGTGTFRPVSPVVFIGVVEGISQCEQMAADVRQGPLVIQRQFPYHPHVTVAHDLPYDLLQRAFDEMATYDVRFEVWGFSLYEHGADAVWRPQRDFPLGQELPGPRSQ